MATEVGDANRGRDARKVALAMEFEDFLAAHGVLGDGVDNARPIFDELARLKARGQIATVALRISITGGHQMPRSSALSRI
jgi:hypothetical protein